jgi:hypothetical protein
MVAEGWDQGEGLITENTKELSGIMKYTIS